MRIARGLIGILALLALTRAANAQFFSPVGASSFAGTGFRHHHHFSSRHYYWSGIGYYPYYPYWDSGFYSPAIYWYSFPATAPYAATVINQPPPDRVPRRPVEEELPKGKVLIKPGPAKAKEEPKEKKEDKKAKAEPPLPGVPASVFRPVQPADRERALQPVAPQEPKGPPEPVQALPPGESPPLPQPVEPTADPKDLVRIGQEVFAAHEYGRAERLFRQAARNEPKEPSAFFLLAQARFMVGKYQEAVAAIHEGLLAKPDWPQSDFQTLRLYDAQVTDFQDQLDHLKKVAAQNAADASLAFLYGYQLWFAGRKEEAKPFFGRAATDVKEKDFCRPFLQDRQEAPPAKK